MWKVVFDAAAKPWEPMMFIPVMFLFIGIGRVWYERVNQASRFRGFGYFFAGLALLISVTTIGSYATDRHRRISDLRAGSVRVAEGNVHILQVMPSSGHSMEHIVVGKVPFTFSDYVITPCFNNTISHGGPLKEGTYARVKYSENCILQIEIGS